MSTLAGILFFYIVFSLLLYYFFKRDPAALTLRQLGIAFGAKIAAGCLYGYIFEHYYGGDDTWAFHFQSLDEYQKLIHNPAQFFKDLLPISAIRGAAHSSQIIPFYLMDLENGLLPKLLALFNIFSRGNYYVNTVFLNALFFIGTFRLYSWLSQQAPGKKTVLYIGLFLVPSIVFWLSGIRAEGILFLFLAFVWIYFDRLLRTGKRRYIWTIAFALLGILIFRAMLLFLVLPAMVAWYLSARLRQHPVKVFIYVYLASVILFFASSYISKEHNFPNIIVKRQQEFFALHGNTRFQLDVLEPSLPSFVHVFPQAFSNSFLRPYVWEAKGLLQWVAALEIIAFWCLMLFFLMRKDSGWRYYFRTPGLVAFLFFGASLYIFIGYSVPFPGAIVRYKIIGELFLAIPVIISSRWKI